MHSTLLGLEELEARVVPATNSWLNNVSGDWSTASNWSLGHTPLASEDAQINFNDITVTHNNGSTDTVNSLTSAASFSLSAGTLSITTTGQFNNSFTLTGIGTLTGSGTITMSGPMTWTDGTMSGSGVTNLQGGLSAPSGFLPLDTRTLNNFGTATQSNIINVSNGAVINNESGANWNLQSGAGFNVGMVHLGAATFNNVGTLQQFGGLNTTSVEMSLNNSGTLAVHGFELDLDGDGTHSGSFTVDRESLLVFDGGSDTFANGVVVNGTGAVSLISGTLTLAGSATIDGTYTQSSNGSLDVEINGASQFSHLTVGGAVMLGGTLNIMRSAGFVPTPGQTFQIVGTSPSDIGNPITGTFATVNGLAINSSEHFAVNQGINDQLMFYFVDLDVVAFDKFGAYRPSDGSWSLDSDGGRIFNPATSQTFFRFSPPGVLGVAGDWNGTGHSQIGDFSNGVWHLDLAGTGAAPGANETFQFGQAGDQPVVGDWDGNSSGRDELGVFRTAPDGITGEFILDIANHKTMDSSNLVFTFGFGTDHIVVGDWTGNGTTKVGVYRDAKDFIPADAGDIVFSINDSGDHVTFTNFVFGLITDKVVIGDWTGDGKAKVGVYRDGSNGFNAPGVALFSLDSGALMFNAQSQVFLFGFTTDQFVSGNWAPTPPLLPAQFSANGVGPGAPALTPAQLAPVFQQAIADWAATGANVGQLESVSVQIGNLNGNLLGWTSGNQITIDANADGWGWNTDTSSVAASKMDLLTVVEHELGHELGLSDVDPATHPGDLMASTLPTGTRRFIGG